MKYLVLNIIHNGSLYIILNMYERHFPESK